MEKQKKAVVLIAIISTLSVCFAEEDPNKICLGIKCAEVTRDLFGQLVQDGIRLPRRNGFCVTFVYENSPAEVAGLTKGDLICQINNMPISNLNDLHKVLAENGTEKAALITGFSMAEKEGRLVWRPLRVQLKPILYKELMGYLAKLCPLQITKTRMGANTINTPYVEIYLFNRTQKTIVGFKAKGHTWNSFDEPQKDINTLGQEAILPQKDNSFIITLYNNNIATRGDIIITSVRYEDGTEWVLTDEPVSYSPFKMKQTIIMSD